MQPPPLYPWDVFVSHNLQQKPWVRKVVAQWRALNLRVFFDEDSIPPGLPVAKAIDGGIRESRHILVILSPSAVASDWVHLEMAMTVTADPSGAARRLIPVLLEEMDQEKIPLFVRRLSWTDLTKTETRRDQYHLLLRSLLPAETTVELPDPPEWGKVVPTPNLANASNPAKAQEVILGQHSEFQEYQASATRVIEDLVQRLTDAEARILELRQQLAAMGEPRPKESKPKKPRKKRGT
jgi:hypothetical protein